MKDTSCFQMLDPTAHGNIRMQTRGFGFNHFSQVVLPELASATTLCPVLFCKEPDSGDLFLCALLGFKPEDPPLIRVDASTVFVPLSLQCAGFFIQDEYIAIDRNHPRFSEGSGEPLFNESGQTSSAMREVQINLPKFQKGLEKTSDFIQFVVAKDLVEPVDIDMKFDDGERIALNGLYTLSHDKLNNLDDDAILELHRRGYLGAAHLIASSIRQLSVMAELRNKLISH